MSTHQKAHNKNTKKNTPIENILPSTDSDEFVRIIGQIKKSEGASRFSVESLQTRQLHNSKLKGSFGSKSHKTFFKVGDYVLLESCSLSISAVESEKSDFYIVHQYTQAQLKELNKLGYMSVRAIESDPSLKNTSKSHVGFEGSVTVTDADDADEIDIDAI